jgi:tRNA dimethylallyltransferase
LEEVIVIVGPTCSGKTKISLEIAERINSEIISADSRQIYKHLDIGTAKPQSSDIKKVKHHFIDELDPKEDFNVSIFAVRASAIIQKLIDNNTLPIIVGGSGLYIKAVIDGITDSADTNKEIRTELLELRQKYGNDYLYDELKKVDEISASKMLPQNWKRVMRALEVYRLTGKPIWQHHQSVERTDEFNFLQVGLLWNRKTLYQNIEKRVDEMIELGLIKEVKNLIDSGYSKSLNALNTVGYKEIIQYLDNEISLDRAIELIKRNTRHYAKRQMTWFNKDNRITWYQIHKQSDLIDVCEKIVKMIKR